MSGAVTGSDELDRQLEALQVRIVRRATSSGTNAGMTVIARAVRVRAPVGKTKAVKKNIGKRLVKGQPTGTLLGKVGVNVGKRSAAKSRRFAPHGHLVTLGTVDRYTARGAYRGRGPINSFVSQGFAASKNEAGNQVIDKVRESIVKAGGQ